MEEMVLESMQVVCMSIKNTSQKIYETSKQLGEKGVIMVKYNTLKELDGYHLLTTKCVPFSQLSKPSKEDVSEYVEKYDIENEFVAYIVLECPKSSFVEIIQKDSQSSKVVQEYMKSEMYCSRCEKVEDLKQCSQCKMIYYCSPECQELDWSKHKELCNKAVGK